MQFAKDFVIKEAEFRSFIRKSVNRILENKFDINIDRINESDKKDGKFSITCEININTPLNLDLNNTFTLENDDILYHFNSQIMEQSYYVESCSFKKCKGQLSFFVKNQIIIR